MRMMRCTVARMDIAVGDVTESIWKDHAVDFDRELTPGFTLGDAVAGREDCFEPVGGEFGSGDVDTSRVRLKSPVERPVLSLDLTRTSPAKPDEY